MGLEKCSWARVLSAPFAWMAHVWVPACPPAREVVEARLVAWAARELRRRQAQAAKGRAAATLSVAEVARLFPLPQAIVRKVLREQCECITQRVGAPRHQRAILWSLSALAAVLGGRCPPLMPRHPLSHAA